MLSIFTVALAGLFFWLGVLIDKILFTVAFLLIWHWARKAFRELKVRAAVRCASLRAVAAKRFGKTRHVEP